MDAVATRIGHPGRRGSAAPPCSPAIWPRWRGRRSVDGDAALVAVHPAARSSRCSRCSPTRRRRIGERARDARRGVVRAQARRRRIQVHKVGDEVKVYSRNLRRGHARGPRSGDDRARDAGARDRPRRRSDRAAPGRPPHPFQITMRRFGRKLDVDSLRRELPITPMFFDALYLDGDPLVDEPLTPARRAARRAGQRRRTSCRGC